MPMAIRSWLIAGVLVAAVLLVAFAVRAGSSTAAAASSTGVEAEVRAVELKWVDAELRRDAAAVAQLLDDKFLFIVGARPPKDKEQFVKAVPTFTSISQVLSEQIVRVDGDTAVIWGRDTGEWPSPDGSRRTENWRYTSIYIRRNGAWRAFVEHMVPEEPSTAGYNRPSAAFQGNLASSTR
jgi:uncharacterized protein (TIGR02246 family)